MKFMLEFPAKGSPFSNSRPEDLKEAKRLLQGALENGKLDCAYSKVGGGGYAVMNADSIADLRLQLRRLNVHDVNIQPISELVDVIDGYIEYHESGAHEELKQKAAAYHEHAASGYPEK
jgi:hypothetical protein